MKIAYYFLEGDSVQSIRKVPAPDAPITPLFLWVIYRRFHYLDYVESDVKSTNE
jgi:hypothetical protein